MKQGAAALACREPPLSATVLLLSPHFESFEQAHVRIRLTTGHQLLMRLAGPACEPVGQKILRWD